MHIRSHSLGVLFAALSVAALARDAGAITAGAFGANGAGGRLNGQTLAVGAGGLVDELDAWLLIDGQDLNGAAAGVTAQLSTDALPTGLALTFSATLSGDSSDLVLRYVFTNGTGADLASLTFLSLSTSRSPSRRRPLQRVRRDVRFAGGRSGQRG